MSDEKDVPVEDLSDISIKEQSYLLLLDGSTSEELKRIAQTVLKIEDLEAIRINLRKQIEDWKNALESELDNPSLQEEELERLKDIIRKIDSDLDDLDFNNDESEI